MESNQPLAQFTNANFGLVPGTRKIRGDFEFHRAVHDFVNHPRQQAHRLATVL
jgi:hypothetical protein